MIEEGDSRHELAEMVVNFQQFCEARHIELPGEEILTEGEKS